MKHRQLGCWAARPFGIVSNHVSRAPAADRDSSPLKFQPLLLTWKAVNPIDGLVLSQVVLSFGIPMALVPLAMLGGARFRRI
jgi:hypothetical protein